MGDADMGDANQRTGRSEQPLRVSRRVVAIALLAGGTSGCAAWIESLFGIHFNLPETFRARIRYSLLASMEQVTNAAFAELKRIGPTDRRELDADSTRFVFTDQSRGSGESELTMRKDGNLLVAEFRFSLKDLKKGDEPDGKQRSNRVFKVLAKLPGVGPVVDSDGIPKDRQFRGLEEQVRATDPVPGAEAQSPPPAAGIVDGGRP